MCLGTGEVVVVMVRGERREGGREVGWGWGLCLVIVNIFVPPLPHTQSPLSRSCPVLRHLPQRLTLDGLSSPPRVSLFFSSFSKVLIFP